MDNSVTLFLLFTYSGIMGIVAFFYLSGRLNKGGSAAAPKEKTLKFRRRHNLLEKLTDPVFNAQYEIGRKLKKNRDEKDQAAADAHNAPGAAEAHPALRTFAAEPIAEETRAAESVFKQPDANDDEPVRYEIDEQTLQLLVSTFAYDDFAKIYEKFLRAGSEDDICRLIRQLEDFREDDRLLMILTPLLSHESARVQNAVNGFIMRTNKSYITEEMVNIIENSEYIQAVQKMESQSEYNSGPAGMNNGIYYSADGDMNLSVDRSVFFEQPHKLIMEAYQTVDRDRLFAISCALAQYDDPMIVEAMLYINSKLNGEIDAPETGSNILKSPVLEHKMTVEEIDAPARPAGVIKSGGEADGGNGVQKFNFASIGEIFKTGAPETRASFKQLSKNVSNYQTKRPNNHGHEDTSSSNDYVKGIKLVNISRFAGYDECMPAVTDALNHDSVYVRCCAITALKTLAGRAFAGGDSVRFDEIKKTMMSHELFEKNTEVASLCAKAITEIENYSSVSFDTSETGETQNEYAFHPGQAEGAVSMANELRSNDAVNQ